MVKLFDSTDCFDYSFIKTIANSTMYFDSDANFQNCRSNLEVVFAQVNRVHRILKHHYRLFLESLPLQDSQYLIVMITKTRTTHLDIILLIVLSVVIEYFELPLSIEIQALIFCSPSLLKTGILPACLCRTQI